MSVWNWSLQLFWVVDICDGGWSKGRTLIVVHELSGLWESTSVWYFSSFSPLPLPPDEMLVHFRPLAHHPYPSKFADLLVGVRHFKIKGSYLITRRNHLGQDSNTYFFFLRNQPSWPFVPSLVTHPFTNLDIWRRNPVYDNDHPHSLTPSFALDTVMTIFSLV